jgi:hypothetical protein
MRSSDPRVDIGEALPAMASAADVVELVLDPFLKRCEELLLASAGLEPKNAKAMSSSIFRCVATIYEEIHLKGINKQLTDVLGRELIDRVVGQCAPGQGVILQAAVSACLPIFARALEESTEKCLNFCDSNHDGTITMLEVQQTTCAYLPEYLPFGVKCLLARVVFVFMRCVLSKRYKFATADSVAPLCVAESPAAPLRASSAPHDDSSVFDGSLAGFLQEMADFRIADSAAAPAPANAPVHAGLLAALAPAKADLGVAAGVEVADLEVAGAEIADLKVTDMKVTDMKVTDLKVADVKVMDVKVMDVKAAALEDADVKVTDLKVADAKVVDVKAAELEVTDFKVTDLKVADKKATDLKVAEGDPDELADPVAVLTTEQGLLCSAIAFETRGPDVCIPSAVGRAGPTCASSIAAGVDTVDALLHCPPFMLPEAVIAPSDTFLDMLTEPDRTILRSTSKAAPKRKKRAPAA